MFCNKCGKEIPKGSVFCNFCGHEVEKDLEENHEQAVKVKISKKNNKLIIGIIISILVVIVASVFLLKSNPINAVLKAMDNKEYEKMTEVYKEDIKGNLEKEKELSEKLKLEVDTIFSKYEMDKISYEASIDELDELNKLGIIRGNIDDAKRKIKDLNKSRLSFISGEEFDKSKNYIDAILAYKKVVKEDTKNYNAAQNKINELSSDYKLEVLSTVEKHREQKDYKDALKLIKDAIKILPEDNELKAKKDSYSKLLEEQLALERQEKFENARDNQLITVEKTNILIQDTRHKTLYPDLYEVIIKNNSDKTLKSYRVSMLGWDKNGYPLKIKQSFLDSSGSYEFLGSGDNVNILQGDTGGKNSGWKLEEDHNIHTMKAVVIEAEFYDGFTWENDYYEYFLEEFEGKPLVN